MVVAFIAISRLGNAIMYTTFRSDTDPV